MERDAFGFGGDRQDHHKISRTMVERIDRRSPPRASSRSPGTVDTSFSLSGAIHHSELPPFHRPDVAEPAALLAAEHLLVFRTTGKTGFTLAVYASTVKRTALK